MILKNTTKKTVLARKVKKARSLNDNLFGLTRYTKPVGMIFQTRYGIHTIGMKFPIDVIILDRHNRVVDLKKNLQPNRLFFWNPYYSCVVELPSGTIQNSQTELSDRLSLSAEQ